MENKIQFGDPIGFELPIAELPKGIPQDLELSYDPNFRVYMLEYAHQQMLGHVREDTRKECGGVLVGYPFRTPNLQTVFVIIVGIVRNESDDRGVAHFTFSPDDISKTRNYIADKYPGLIAVGWYHSHPGHGIFLSGQDMTIVRAIYNAPWNIAWVVDPIHEQEGIFYSHRGIPLLRSKSSWKLSERPMYSLPDPQIIKHFVQGIQELQKTDAVRKTLWNVVASEKDLSKRDSTNVGKRISIVYPRFLSKRFESTFLVQLYYPHERQQVLKNINSRIGGKKFSEHRSPSEIKPGKKVKVSLYSDGISFSPAKTKKITASISSYVFLGTPSDNCQPGKHKVLVSVFDDISNIELDAFEVSVKVVDFAFDHISRPFLSKLSSVILGIGTFSMFLLSYLEQIDKTLGLVSGTSAGLIATIIYLNFYSLYQRAKTTIQ